MSFWFIAKSEFSMISLSVSISRFMASIRICVLNSSGVWIESSMFSHPYIAIFTSLSISTSGLRIFK